MISIRKYFFKIVKKNRIIKEDVGYCCSKKMETKSHSFSAYSKCCTNSIKTVAWHNSETKCHLKMKICTDSYFYEILHLKMCYNLDWLL